MMQHWKMTLEYDGTDFAGWQVQPNARTVQEEMERAVQQITGERARVTGAGRTDSGVHATGQVAATSFERELGAGQFLKGLNGVLPVDVRVKDVSAVASTFHPRYDATSRTYVYTIILRPSALMRRTAWQIGWHLDEQKLNTAAGQIMGEHDFTSFAKVDASVDHHRCTVLRSDWHRSGDLLTYTVSANRFMYGMVRALVGTMIEVARGYRSGDDLPKILDARDRTLAGMSAPAHGLCLVDVSYGAV